MKVSGREVYPERQSREALAGQRKRKIIYIQIAANQNLWRFLFLRGDLMGFFWVRQNFFFLTSWIAPKVLEH
jgi:hypothetical protein